jgi:hypothetical protein
VVVFDIGFLEEIPLKNYFYLHLTIFGGILIFLTILLLTASVGSERKSIVIDFISKESAHIQNIDLAKTEYLHTKRVLENTNNNEIKARLNERPFEIFRNEKFLLGIDKDAMIAELKGLPGTIDKEVVAFGNAINEWCESVKDDTIESFSTTPEGDQKFLALMRIRDQATTLRRMYSSSRFTLLDFILLGIPLLASLAGLIGQAYSLYKEHKFGTQSSELPQKF